MDSGYLIVLLLLGLTILGYVLWLHTLDDDPMQNEIFQLIISFDRSGAGGRTRFVERFSTLTSELRHTVRARRLMHALLQARPQISPRTYNDVRKMFSPTRRRKVDSKSYRLRSWH
jgi:hypothetical protein